MRAKPFDDLKQMLQHQKHVENTVRYFITMCRQTNDDKEGTRMITMHLAKMYPGIFRTASSDAGIPVVTKMTSIEQVAMFNHSNITVAT